MGCNWDYCLCGHSMCNLVIVDSGYMNVKAYGGHVVSRKVNLLSWDLISYSAN